MVSFYFSNFMLIVDFHPRWLCRYLRRRILSGLLNLCWGLHLRWRFRDLWRYWHFRGMLKEFGHFCVGVSSFEPYVSEGMGFFLVGASFFWMRSNMSSAVWVK